MRNRIASVAIVVTMVVGALCLTFNVSEYQRISHIAVSESIDGNSALLPSPENYAFVVKKSDTDPLSKQLAADFETKPNFVALRKYAACKTYTEGDAFTSNNLKMIKTTPAVVVMKGDEIVYKKSGPNVRTASVDISTCFPRLRPKPKPEPTPEPTPEPADEPADTTPEPADTQPTPAKNDHMLGLILAGILGVVGGLVAYFHSND